MQDIMILSRIGRYKPLNHSSSRAFFILSVLKRVNHANTVLLFSIPLSFIWSYHTSFTEHVQLAKQNHEEGDHYPDFCENRQVPEEGHESGSYGHRGAVGDAGRRREEPAAGDRRGRGHEQADQETQEEGGLGGDRRAEDGRLVRGGGGGVPARDDPGEQGRSRQGDGGGAGVAVPPPPPAVAVPPPTVAVRHGAQPVRVPVPVPVPPVASDGRAARRRLRGQQLLPRGGAQPPGQLLAAGREARLPPHGQLLHHQEEDQPQHRRRHGR